MNKEEIIRKTESRIWQELLKIKGGYKYDGVASSQICFPLKNGGELRFGFYDERTGNIEIDLYGGELPPGITGPATLTG